MKAFYGVVMLFATVCATAQNLTSIESAEFDALNHRFLISNSSNLVVVDATGSGIASLPIPVEYGMEVIDSNVFAISGGSVICHNLNSGLEISSVAISGAQFLNGMATDGSGRIWVTDFTAKKIHEIDFSDIENPVANVIVNNTVTTPNGICYDAMGNRLVFVSWGNSAPIKAVNLNDYSVTTILSNSGVGNIDGIDNDNYGNYFISSWTPNRITQFNSDFSVSQTITVAGGLNSAADIAYAEEIDTLIIPNSGNNSVRFIGFSPSVSVHDTDNLEGIRVFPNPTADFMVVDFVMTASELVLVSLLDNFGRSVDLLWNGTLPTGSNKLVLDLSKYSSGVYHLQISGDSLRHSHEVVINR